MTKINDAFSAGNSSVENNENQSNENRSLKQHRYYMTAWRWHFYAGLYVIPFLLILAVTGMLMLFDEDIERLRYGDLISVQTESSQVSASEQLESVRQAYPDYKVTQYIPSKHANEANRFSVEPANGDAVFVTVNPYDGNVLGEIDRSQSIYQYANKIHSTLMLGSAGDYLIEVAASLGILLILTGLYMWIYSARSASAPWFKVRFNAGARTCLRDIHVTIGSLLSLVLLFFFISGLSWTGIWGAKFVQAWNTFPTYYTWGEKPESVSQHSGSNHASLNHGSEEEMPWNLELAPLPESTKTAENAHIHGQSENTEVSSPSPAHLVDSISLDEVISKANELGYTQFRVFFPANENGVYTIAANSMAGDISDPRHERTSHLDQYSGELLIDVTWDDYSTYAKFMAAGVSLHQGDVSVINKTFNALFCVFVIALSVAGIMMWVKRRPSRQKLAAPPSMKNRGYWITGMIGLVVVALAFPLGGLTILAVLTLDWCLIRRNPRLSQFFGSSA